MNIEDVKIEDAADANYVIRKFFNDQLSGLKMSQLEQLVLTVYKMGKNSGTSAGSKSDDSSVPDSSDMTDISDDDADAEEAIANPFKINDRAEAIEDIEIEHTGEVIRAGTVGTVSSVRGDKVSFLFESSEFGEMIEASVTFDKLEKTS